MDHVVIPLDEDHVRAAAHLVEGIAAAAGLGTAPDRTRPHVTLLAYTGGDPAEVLTAVQAVAAATEPFVLRAHGYGFFSGGGPADLSLHVPVVRAPALDALHRDLCSELGRAGAEVAGWCTPALWTPHVTLVDRGLDAAGLGEGAAWLARRHHPSWHVRVERLGLTGGRVAREQGMALVALGPGRPPA